MLSDQDDKHLQKKGRTNYFGFRAVLLACWTVEIANDEIIFLEHLENERHTEEIVDRPGRIISDRKAESARNTAGIVR